MIRSWSQLRSCRPAWAVLLALPFVANVTWVAAEGQLHWENVTALAAVLGLLALGARGEKLLAGIYPFGLVGVLYSAMHFFERVGVSPERVHLCDLRRHELALFGVTMNGERVTLHDWFQAHSSPILDVICSIPYGTFIFVSLGFAAWLYFRDYPRMVRFAWSWFALNVAGFITYHIYPAAPPWYYHAYGCHVNVLAHASEGPNLARVDGWLGVPYFHGMYGRASDTFGAVPSLHVAYALIIVLEGWAIMRALGRAASVTFFVWMTFSAIYLDHHWVIDALVGMAYCVVVVTVARLVTKRVHAPRAAPGAAAELAQGAAVDERPETAAGADGAS